VRDTLELGHQAPQLESGLIPEVAAVEDKGPIGEDCLGIAPSICLAGIVDSLAALQGQRT